LLTFLPLRGNERAVHPPRQYSFKAEFRKLQTPLSYFSDGSALRSGSVRLTPTVATKQLKTPTKQTASLRSLVTAVTVTG